MRKARQGLGESQPKSARVLAPRLNPPHAQKTLQSGLKSPDGLLVREWDRRSQRVMVMADGFAWNGQTYDSLSKVAFAITGTKWNGPRFFGLRDKGDRSAMEARP